MIYMLYGAGYLYMLLTLVLAARYRDMLLKRQRNAAILLLIFSIVPIFVQQFFMSHQLIELFFQSIGIFGFLTTVENLDEVYHPVTKVYNRAAFLRAGYTAFETAPLLTWFMVKLSRSSCVGLEMTHAGCLNSFLGAVAEWLERSPGGRTYMTVNGALCADVLSGRQIRCGELDAENIRQVLRQMDRL